MHSKSMFPRRHRTGGWGFFLFLLVTIPALILFFQSY
jgi:hypothetical protein